MSPVSRSEDPTVVATGALAVTVDRLATEAALAALDRGGSAADGAVAAGAVLAVTTQHMCGMGGDLFALVHRGTGAPAALAAVGRAGSGADAGALRDEGLTAMPFRRDVRSSTVPGCVDGWIALQERFGRLSLPEVLAPARALAADGFAASPLLARRAPLVAELPGADDFRRPGGLRAGDRVRRPRVARVLDEIASAGRAGFYHGAFGAGLVDVGAGLYTPEDLERSCAAWVAPTGVDVWGHTVWTVPPPSQGYLTLAGAWIAARLALPGDPDDAGWAHLLAEAARVSGADRRDLLADGVDPTDLLAPARLAAQLRAIDPDRRSGPAAPVTGGGTVQVCVVDDEGTGVSLMQSNAAGWGCHLVVPGTGIFLHNRGIGFRLDPGHPAELGPGRRPAHTLAPALVTAPGGGLRAVLGSMGGDIQPQVVLQVLARVLHHGQSPGTAVAAPRWKLGDGGFHLWDDGVPQVTSVEHAAPATWCSGLERRGHRVVRAAPGDNFGQANVIEVRLDGSRAGAVDPRALTGAAAGGGRRGGR